MTASVQLAGVSRYRRVPWSPRAWRQTLYLTGGIPAQLLPAIVVFWALFVKVPHSSRTVAAEVLVMAAFLLIVVLAVPALTVVHRHRLRVTTGADIPERPPLSDAPMLSGTGLAAAFRSEATWRQLAYHLIAAPALALAAMAAFGTWILGLYFLLALPLRVAGGPHATRWPLAALLLAALALLAAAPWATSFVSGLDARTARALLGPSRAELEHRVTRLKESRAGVVDAADAERRRLERDLHDGTQQRLVSLAMNLGLARARAGTLDEAQAAIAAAHEEAKTALAELRDLVRGLHPAVLEDRGLDAALSGITARMPIPVKLTVDDMARRPSPAIEAVAYFVVSEGLTNIAKHSRASQAEVIVQRSGNRLHIIITDDGNGGADPARGSGLAGLARRAASVDGTFEISSPEGGPTMLTVDLPCSR
ncbi:MAG: histidine kinase [Streptosporangiales bacterium]|nr:histidine kinase [Streptosporangiales bacterium]